MRPIDVVHIHRSNGLGKDEHHFWMCGLLGSFPLLLMAIHMIDRAALSIKMLLGGIRIMDQREATRERAIPVTLIAQAHCSCPGNVCKRNHSSTRSSGRVQLNPAAWRKPE